MTDQARDFHHQHLQGKDVTYSLRALPLGGYVGFPDDDPKSKIPKDDPNLLKNRPILDRAIVLSAGVIFNIIFAWSILFTQVSLTWGPPGLRLWKVPRQQDVPRTSSLQLWQHRAHARVSQAVALV